MADSFPFILGVEYHYSPLLPQYSPSSALSSCTSKAKHDEGINLEAWLGLKTDITSNFYPGTNIYPWRCINRYTMIGSHYI